MPLRSITAEQVGLVRSSFATLVPRADQVAALFYEQLFAINPGLRALFRADPERQGERLMQMLGQAVALLDRPLQLSGVLHALGRRHVAYGVKQGHYADVGRALLNTLSLGLGCVFGHAELQAWSAVYAMISRTMQEDLCITGRAA